MRQLVKTKLLIDCKTDAPIEKGCMLVEGGCIIAVGREADFENIENVEVLDFSEQYVMPGLIEGHDHLSISHRDPVDLIDQMKRPGQEKILRAMLYLKENIDSGVTTIRTMGEEDFIDLDIKDAINKGLIKGPRILASGNIITARHAHGAAKTISDGVDDIIKNVRANLERGADLIKLIVTGGVASGHAGINVYTYSYEEIKAAVDEAKRVGKYVAAHGHGGEGVDLCIKAGVRSIEHGCMLNDEQIEGIIKNDMWVTGTFSAAFSDEGLIKNASPDVAYKLLQVRENVAVVYDKLLKANVNMCLGTDCMHGNLRFEAQCLEKFGASKMKALLSLTRESARSCEIDDQVGTLEVGKLADFIVLEKNPLDDLENLKTVREVFKLGIKLN